MTDKPPKPEATSPQTEPAKPRPSWRRHLWRALTGILVVLFLLLLSVAWLLGSDTGFQSLWHWAGRLSHQVVSVDKVKGNLWDGFSLQGLRYETADQKLQVSSLKWQWSGQSGWQHGLDISYIDIGDVTWASSAPSSKTPPQAPSSLKLPLDIRVGRVALASLRLPANGLVFSDLTASYRYHNQQHTLKLNRFVTPWGEVLGDANIGAVAPFKLKVDTKLHGALEGYQAQANLAVSGNLLEPKMNLQGHSTGALIDIQGTFKPFASLNFERVAKLKARLSGIDPAKFMPSLPQAKLALAADMIPDGQGGLQGGMSLINHEAGRLDEQKLPLSLLAAQFNVTDNVLRVSHGLVQAGGGIANIDGQFNAKDFLVKVGLEHLPLQGLNRHWPDQTLTGQLRIGGPKFHPDIQAKFHTKQLKLDANAIWHRQGALGIDLKNLLVQAGAGQLQAHGSWSQTQSQAFMLAGTLKGLDPAQLDPRLPKGKVSAAWQLDGQVDPQPEGQLALNIQPSELSGAPLKGQFKAHWQANRIFDVLAQLQLGNNQVSAKGAYGVKGDRLQLNIAANNLGLLGPSFAGQAEAQVLLAGIPSRPLVDANFKAKQLKILDVFIADLQGKGHLDAGGNSPFEISVRANQLKVANVLVSSLDLQGGGTRQYHQIRLNSQFKVGQMAPFDLATRFTGGLNDETVWRGQWQEFNLKGSPALRLMQPVSLVASAKGVDIGAGRWQALDSQWHLQNTRYVVGQGLETAGSVQDFHLASLKPWVEMPVEQNLSLDGQWQIAQQGTALRGKVALKRRSGDVQIPVSKTLNKALGLKDLALQISLEGDRALARLNLDSNMATASAQVSALTSAGLGVDMPLNGKISASIANLNVAQPWLPPGTRISGTAKADINLHGPVKDLALNGPIEAAGLGYYDPLNGIHLKDGLLQAILQNRELVLKSLTFGQDHSLKASGSIALKGDKPEAKIVFLLNRFQALDRPGQRMQLSGNVNLSVQGQMLGIGGQLTVNKARFDMPKLGAPSLSSDVVVLGRDTHKPAEKTWPFDLDLVLNLGQDFKFAGMGLTTDVTGALRLRALPNQDLKAFGQVVTENGRFKAYGQDLDIDKGVITFSGPLDNPGLSIKALRRMSPVGAGIEVTGSVNNPQIQLIADEPMSDKDKLSWLILGRAASFGDDNTEGSAAASAGNLLAGAINDKLGLFDDIGLDSKQATQMANGTVSPAEQVVTLGKQLTKNLYVGYQYGMVSAAQSVKIIYKITKNWSIQTVAGTDASIETRYTVRFD